MSFRKDRFEPPPNERKNKINDSATTTTTTQQQLASRYEELENGWDSRFTRGTIPSLSNVVSVSSSPLSTTKNQSSTTDRDKKRHKITTHAKAHHDLHQKKCKAKKAIVCRESLIAQLDRLIRHEWPLVPLDDSVNEKTKKSQRRLQGIRRRRKQRQQKIGRQSQTLMTRKQLKKKVDRALKTLASQLQKVGLKCVELITSWAISVSTQNDIIASSSSSHLRQNHRHPPRFVYKGDDYLYKMHTDLNFVVEHLGDDTARSYGFDWCRPLLLPTFAGGANATVSSSSASQNPSGVDVVERCHVAALIIDDVVMRRRREEGEEDEEIRKGERGGDSSKSQRYRHGGGAQDIQRLSLPREMHMMRVPEEKEDEEEEEGLSHSQQYNSEEQRVYDNDDFESQNYSSEEEYSHDNNYDDDDDASPDCITSSRKEESDIVEQQDNLVVQQNSTSDKESGEQQVEDDDDYDDDYDGASIPYDPSDCNTSSPEGETDNVEQRGSFVVQKNPASGEENGEKHVSENDDDNKLIQCDSPDSNKSSPEGGNDNVEQEGSVVAKQSSIPGKENEKQVSINEIDQQPNNEDDKASFHDKKWHDDDVDENENYDDDSSFSQEVPYSDDGTDYTEFS